MTEIVTVTAVYENGVLRPVRRLNLCEQQTVQIQILPSEPAAPPGIEAERELECILRVWRMRDCLLHLLATRVSTPSLTKSAANWRKNWDGHPANRFHRSSLRIGVSGKRLLLGQ